MMDPNVPMWAAQFGTLTYLYLDDYNRNDFDMIVIAGGPSLSLDSQYIDRSVPFTYTGEPITLDTNNQRLKAKGTLLPFMENKTPIVLVGDAVELLPAIKDHMKLIPRTNTGRTNSFIYGMKLNNEIFHMTLPNIQKSRFAPFHKKSEGNNVYQVASMFTHKNKEYYMKTKNITLEVTNPYDIAVAVYGNIICVMYDTHNIVHSNNSYTFKKYGYSYGDIVANNTVISMLKGGNGGGGTSKEEITTPPVLTGYV